MSPQSFPIPGAGAVGGTTIASGRALGPGRPRLVLFSGRSFQYGLWFIWLIIRKKLENGWRWATYKSSVTVTSKICPAVVGHRGAPINVPFEVCDEFLGSWPVAPGAPQAILAAVATLDQREGWDPLSDNQSGHGMPWPFQFISIVGVHTV